MNRTRLFVMATLIGFLVLLAVVIPALAGVGTQLVTPSFTLVDSDGNTIADIWEVDGEWFVSGSVDHFCPCGTGECRTVPIPTSEDTPIFPTNTPTDPTPTDTPVPTDTPTPDEPKCNRGIGNYEENCDPGTSGSKGQGDGRRAGEDRDEPTGPHK